MPPDWLASNVDGTGRVTVRKLDVDRHLDHSATMVIHPCERFLAGKRLLAKTFVVIHAVKVLRRRVG
jgi:hypothetical protein